MQHVPVLYREANHQMSRKFLDDATYARAIEAFVIDCTDAVIVDRRERVFYLAKRVVLPMKGIWVIGGRRFAGESLHESVRRRFRRETGLDLLKERFAYVVGQDIIWKDREQEPQDVGSHNFCHRFTVELTPEERDRAARSLEKKEYEQGFGLRKFTFADLVVANVHQSLIDLYDLIFGPAAR